MLLYHKFLEWSIGSITTTKLLGPGPLYSCNKYRCVQHASNVFFSPSLNKLGGWIKKHMDTRVTTLTISPRRYDSQRLSATQIGYGIWGLEETLSVRDRSTVIHGWEKIPWKDNQISRFNDYTLCCAYRQLHISMYFEHMDNGMKQFENDTGTKTKTWFQLIKVVLSQHAERKIENQSILSYFINFTICAAMASCILNVGCKLFNQRYWSTGIPHAGSKEVGVGVPFWYTVQNAVVFLYGQVCG